MTTIEKLLEIKNANYTKVRMPSIKEIAKMLEQNGLECNIFETTRTVEYRTAGKRYVNSRHEGKSGYILTVKENRSFKLDSTDTYYSANKWWNASAVINLLVTHWKVTVEAAYLAGFAPSEEYDVTDERLFKEAREFITNKALRD